MVQVALVDVAADALVVEHHVKLDALQLVAELVKVTAVEVAALLVKTIAIQHAQELALEDVMVDV